MPSFQTGSEEETIALGARLARDFPAKAVVLLIGNLGAGKTTLAKGIAEGAGAADRDQVSSPTYTLIHEYGEGPKVYHVDLFRIDTAREAAALGLEELFDRNALVLVEWGERYPELLPPERIEIRLEAARDDQRTITVTRIGL